MKVFKSMESTGNAKKQNGKAKTLHRFVKLLTFSISDQDNT